MEKICQKFSKIVLTTMKLTAVVLTKNEEKNIEKCLKSLTFCDEVIAIDDLSEDGTISIINKLSKSIKVFQRKLNDDFAGQRNFGLSKSKNEWVLFVDADESVTDDLRAEILRMNFQKESYFIRRRDYFWNQELKYGEIKKVRDQGIVRLVKKSSGKWMGDVHEIFRTSKNTGQLNSFLDHYPHPTIKEFINDINRYSDIRSQELFNRGVKTNILEIIFFPSGKFINNYFFNLGFLDGPAGFTYSFMMSFHSFLVRSKLYQLTNKQ